MKFGKIILSNQIPGWSQYYLDYKGLKKIISALESSTTQEETTKPQSITPGQLLGRNLIHPSQTSSVAPDSQIPFSISSSVNEDDRGAVYQAHKAAFFFKLERELEKINTFYLQKEAELKVRLATLLTKRNAASQSIQTEQDAVDQSIEGVEWLTVEEGFRLLDKDLGKLQQFIEINATGFRKILKKWDKRAKSTTKELYLTRQVEVQPCFNRQLLAELADTVTACLLDLSDRQYARPTESSSIPGSTSQRMASRTALRDLEVNIASAVAESNTSTLQEVLSMAESLAQDPEAKTQVIRILWKAAIDAEPPLADAIICSKAYDMRFVDDINGRTCLHGAAIAGEARLVKLCVANKNAVNAVDAYGRTALHYASMNGHGEVCTQLLSLGADPTIVDRDNYSPLVYAIIEGHTDCVQVLLSDHRALLEPTDMLTDITPLSLACRFGHVQIALFLLDKGAQSLPNTNGEYPLHLAAKEGHSDICRILLRHDGGVQKDIPDKYNEWTPLFHSARHGHTDTVQILLDARCNPHTVDETGQKALFYAAWFGHIPCVELLLAAMKVTADNTDPSVPKSFTSPSSDIDITPPDDFMDSIPSLSLPPPIMPFKIYGHSYLDKAYLIQIALGHPFTTASAPSQDIAQLLSNAASFSPAPVQLLSTMLGKPQSHNLARQRSGSSLKLVMTPKSTSSSAPHTVTLPMEEDKELETFMFQLPSLTELELEFSFYPSFGSKAIGKAVVLPGAFRSMPEDGSKTMVLPILDHKLHVLGQVAFETCIITPFNGVSVEVGNTVDTYWKSTSLSTVNPSAQAPSARIVLGSSVGPIQSTRSHLGGSNASSPALSTTGATTLTTTAISSSLSGEYVHVIVQVTRDRIPVVCPEYVLPVEGGYGLGVADVTLEQFTRIAKASGREFKPPAANGRLAVATEWHVALRSRYNLGRGIPLNVYTDQVLQTIYNSRSKSSNQRTNDGRRKIVFSSYEPNVCIAINWKQPNYAVFFISNCGLPSERVDPGSTETDKRCSSVAAAVDFAKCNNILGILINAALLVQVPSLAFALKDSGLLLATFGKKEDIYTLVQSSKFTPDGPNNVLDAVLQDGVLSYTDHSLRSTT
ncbi:ubiquitin-protein ligase peroxin 12 [Tulasnella sp. 418]|nr:ubiquitin-protein ligase peroxin 12 [Tulasnella sp. 418]